MKNTWNVDADADRQRLDIFLAGKLGVSRSQAAKSIKNGEVTVNDKKASVHKFLNTGDKVALLEGQTIDAAGAKHDTPVPEQHATPYLKIIDETDDFIVLDKQSGVLVHPDDKQEIGTLVDALVAHYPKIAKIGEDPERPGIMHRLDKEVSGLMVVAKKQDAFDHLKKQFAEHSVDKKYLALVQGSVSQDEGDIKFRIARSSTKGRMASRPANEEEGKAAWTHYRVLRRFKNASLLELWIFSGRTHQIRAHLLALGHPVFGDTLYTLRGAKSITQKARKTPRLMLQCVHLAFKDPTTGELRTYEIPPVSEFDAVIAKLKPPSA
ncbi:MAG: RluA family pseudouridine synthase [Patescibacteria group bacterium]|nr:RluA family pseudouridine synthase [Patescibacteria group bacterium]